MEQTADISKPNSPKIVEPRTALDAKGALKNNINRNVYQWKV